MAVSGLTLGPPAAADTLSYPYEVSSSPSMAFDWTTPNPVALTVGNTDDGLGTVLLPFRVNIFGHEYPQNSPVTVSTNGTFQFGSSSTAYANTALPTASFSGPTLLPFWDDFEVTPTGQGEGIWWGTSGTTPNRTFAVKWRGYLHSSNPKRRIEFNFVTYEITASTFVFSYFRAPDDPMADGRTATIGIQEGGSTGQYAQFSYNAPLLTPGLGIMFTSKSPANSVSPLVTGPTAEGQTLSATSGTWTPAGAMAYSYKWERCVQIECYTYSDIPGATNATYRLQAGDVGKKVFVAVKASNGWGPAHRVGLRLPGGSGDGGQAGQPDGAGDQRDTGGGVDAVGDERDVVGVADAVRVRVVAVPPAGRGRVRPVEDRRGGGQHVRADGGGADRERLREGDRHERGRVDVHGRDRRGAGDGGQAGEPDGAGGQRDGGGRVHCVGDERVLVGVAHAVRVRVVAVHSHGWGRLRSVADRRRGGEHVRPDHGGADRDGVREGDGHQRGRVGVSGVKQCGSGDGGQAGEPDRAGRQRDTSSGVDAVGDERDLVGVADAVRVRVVAVHPDRRGRVHAVQDRRGGDRRVRPDGGGADRDGVCEGDRHQRGRVGVSGLEQRRSGDRPGCDRAATGR